MAIGTDIENALLALLQGASFAGITTANTMILAEPRISEALLPQLPACILTPADLDEEVRQMSFEDDAALDLVYPYQVTFAAAANRDASQLSTLRTWRQSARLALGVTASAFGVPGVWWIEPAQPGRLLDRNLFPANWAISSLIVRVHSLEPR